MADLKQALIWLAEGKKITRSTIKLSGHFIILNEMGNLTDDEGYPAGIYLDQPGDYILYEEPKHECQEGKWICGLNMLGNLILTINELHKLDRPVLNVRFCPFCGKAEKDL